MIDAISLEHDVIYGVIPPTPDSYNVQPKIPDAYSALLNKSFRLGHVIGYAQEQDGRIIHNVFPVKKMETEQISSSSKVDLALHTETAFHPYRPDYVVLACLRGDANAATTYADIEEIVQDLDDETTQELLKPQFVTSVDISFRLNGEEDQDITTSVLRLDENNRYVLVYDKTVMRGENDAAAEALNKITAAIEKNTRSVILKSGDLLVLNNKRVVHGRNHFTPRYDGTDRWLLRCLVRKELPPADQRNGNIITTARFDRARD